MSIWDPGKCPLLKGALSFVFGQHGMSFIGGSHCGLYTCPHVVVVVVVVVVLVEYSGTS